MFNSAGLKKVKITEAILADAKFNKTPGVFDVVLKVEADTGEYDYWHGEWSTEPGKGNASDKQQHELTQATLTKIGMKEQLMDIGVIQQGQNGEPIIPCLIGLETSVEVEATISEKNGKTYYNIKYLGDGNRPKPIDYNSLMASLGRTPQAPAPAAPAPMPAPAPAAPIPVAMPTSPAPSTVAAPPFPGQAPVAQPAPAPAPNGAFAGLAQPVQPAQG